MTNVLTVKYFCSVVLITMFLLANRGAIAESNIIKADDLRYLPEYCAVRINKGPADKYKRWQDVFGRENFIHLHHFCFGLKYERDVRKARNEREKKFVLQRAAANFNYVYKRWPPSFKIFPEVCGRRGRILEQLGKPAEAAKSYQDAIKASPSFVPGYLALAALYKKTEQIDAAKNVLQRGLAAVPNAAVLKQQLAALN